MITLKYRSDIDGLRGIAVLMTVAFHAFSTVFSGYFIGVDIFFVLSGFLIGSILLQGTQAGSFSYTEFYARRIRRIFPALVTVLAAFLIVGWYTLLSDEYRQLGKHTLAGAGFFSNIAYWREVGYFDTVAETKPLLHLWSLGVEEQFYIFLPPLLMIIARLGLNSRFTLGLIWTLSFAGNAYLISLDKTQAFYSPASRLWELLTGCLVASLYLTPPNRLAVHIRTIRKNKMLINCIAVLGLLLIIVPFGPLHRMHFFADLTILPVAGTALLIIVGELAWLNRAVLSSRLLVWIGLISYPLYLWHWPLLSFARILEGKQPSVQERLVLIAISVALATLTYRHLEKPVRSGAWRKHAVPTLSTLLLIVAAAGAYIWKGEGIQYRSLSQKEQLLSSTKLANFYTMIKYNLPRCGENAAIIGRAKAICSTANLEKNSPLNNAPLLILWGDSHVKSWQPVLSQIAQEQGLRLMVFDYPGCIPLLNVHVHNLQKDGVCSPELANDVMQSIENLKPAIVALISNWNMYINGATYAGVLQPTTHFLTEEGVTDDANGASSRIAFGRQFPSMINHLTATGAHILLMKAPPLLHESVDSGYIRNPLSYEPSLQEHREQAALSTHLIDTAARNPLIKSFDVAPYLCEKKCNAIYQSVVMYAGDSHLTTTGCLIFKPQLQKLIAELAVPAAQ